MASARPASQGSSSEQETPDGQSCFVIPPAMDCDDVPSPSQHILPYASQRRQAGLHHISDDQDQDAADYAITSCPFLGVPPMNGRRSEVV